MNKQCILFGIIGLLSGFIIGFFWTNSVNRNSGAQMSSTTQPAPNNPLIPNASVKEPQTGGGMLPEVAQTLDKAQKEPDNFTAQIRAGGMYLQIQNLPKANEYFQRAAAVHKDNFEELTTLGNSFFDARNFEEAEKWYTQALEKNPDDADVRTDLGSTFVERSPPNFDRAIREYQTVLAKNPNHENALFNLTSALLSKGDLAAARVTLERLKKLEPQSSQVSSLEQRIAASEATK